MNHFIKFKIWSDLAIDEWVIRDWFNAIVKTISDELLYETTGLTPVHFEFEYKDRAGDAHAHGIIDELEDFDDISFFG